MINKKAQGLALNTVVLAALAVIIFVIIMYVLLTNSGNFMDATACASQGGICIDPDGNCALGNIIENSEHLCSTNDRPSNKVCCSLR